MNSFDKVRRHYEEIYQQEIKHSCIQFYLISCTLLLLLCNNHSLFPTGWNTVAEVPCLWLKNFTLFECFLWFPVRCFLPLKFSLTVVFLFSMLLTNWNQTLCLKTSLRNYKCRFLKHSHHWSWSFFFSVRINHFL